MNNNDENNNNHENINNYIVQNEDLYRMTIENLLINLYNDRYNISSNTNNVNDNVDNNTSVNIVPINYYEFYYIYNGYINSYIYNNENNNENLVYIFIVNAFNEYNNILNSINNNDNYFDAQVKTVKTVQTPSSVLESNGVIFTFIDCLQHLDECCSICLCECDVINQNKCDDDDGSFDYVKTSCNHKFHLNCLAKWVGNNKKTCPMCRHNLQQSIQ